MLITHRGFNIFNDYDLNANLENFLSNLQKEIESDRSILQVEEKEYTEEKIEKYKKEPLVISPEKITVSQKEFNIPSEYFPSGFWADRGKSYPKPVLTFRIPFNGDYQLFKCIPSTRLLWTEEVSISNNEIIFEIINFHNDAEHIKRERDEFVKRLTQQISNINNNINSYNEKLKKTIEESIKKAKEKFKNQDDFLSKLGTPTK
jgi:exonuclease VII large subunit